MHYGLSPIKKGKIRILQNEYLGPHFQLSRLFQISNAIFTVNGCLEDFHVFLNAFKENRWLLGASAGHNYPRRDLFIGKPILLREGVALSPNCCFQRPPLPALGQPLN